MGEGLFELDAAGLLAAASVAVRARRLAEVADLEVLAQWAVVHSGEPSHPRDFLVRVGGEGTPGVQEFCLGEIALARGTGVTATSNALADSLTRARLPGRPPRHPPDQAPGQARLILDAHPGWQLSRLTQRSSARLGR